MISRNHDGRLQQTIARPSPTDPQESANPDQWTMSAPQAMASVSQSSIVIGTYRALAELVRRLPGKQQPGAWRQLREGYRKNADERSPEKIANLIKQAGEKIAYLRIVTPKNMWRSNASNSLENSASSSSSTTNQAGVTRWVYRSSGEKDADGQARMRKTRQVVSNYNGSNLDPCSVKRHHGHLKKLGFVNNLHAKGMFWVELGGKIKMMAMGKLEAYRFRTICRFWSQSLFGVNPVLPLLSNFQMHPKNTVIPIDKDINTIS